MKTISLGKFRGLAQASTSKSVFSILALDHRNNLRQAMNPADPQQVTIRDMVAFKSNVVKYVGPKSSAVLLDPQWGAAQCIENSSLPGNVGLICAVEETGYTGNPQARKSRILPGWSVEKAKRMGASAVKLLVYFHPHSETAKAIEELICMVAEDCEKAEIALFLEPLSYPLTDGKKLAPSEKKPVVIETARRLSVLGADVMKVEFPLDIGFEADEKLWAEACSELNQVSAVPWVLLSASVDFETYCRQVRIACDAGASGVAAGRAVWKESVGKTFEESTKFLNETASSRMQRLTEICNQTATPWTKYFKTLDIDADWYLTY